MSLLVAGWILAYGLFCVVVRPVIILFKYYCMGGKERMRVRELELENEVFLSSPRAQSGNMVYA